MLANELISDWLKDRRLKAALEEMAASPLNEIGVPTVSTTCTCHLTGGAKTVRVSITMLPEGEMFAEDLAN
jgi:hypothetical protein